MWSSGCLFKHAWAKLSLHAASQSYWLTLKDIEVKVPKLLAPFGPAGVLEIAVWGDDVKVACNHLW